jgi:hypothetical protein
MRRLQRLWLAHSALALALALGCAAQHTPAWEVQPPDRVTDSAAHIRDLLAQGDTEWMQRGDLDRLLRAIYAWDEVTRLRRDDWQTQVKLARANFLYADAFLSEAAADRSKYVAMLEQGMRHGELAMVALSRGFRTRVEAHGKIEDAIAEIGAAGVGAMVWYAANLQAWSVVKGVGTRRAYRDQIAKIIARCQGLDPSFFYAAPDRLLGAFYALLGDDLERSRRHFEAAIATAPDFLENHVLYAQSYARRRADRELFQRELLLVLAAPAGALPDAEPEQQLARRRAERLLATLGPRFESR